MAKRLLNNPTGKDAQIIHIAQVPDHIQEHIRDLEAKLVESIAKPPVSIVQEKIVEVEKVINDPRLIDKMESLKAELAELKARGAYQLVKHQIPLIQEIKTASQDSELNVEQIANEAREGDKIIILKMTKILCAVSTVGFLFGMFLMWLYLKK